MKKFGKFLAFIGIVGAAVAGFWYFLDKSGEGEYYSCNCKCKCKDDDESDEEVERAYVSLDTSEEKMAEAEAVAKRTLKETVKSVAMDMKQKAEDAAKGIGIVKDEEKKAASDFEFESFDEAKEPQFESNEEA